jgi:hypothetical protein
MAEKRKRETVSAQEQLDTAPVSNKSRYLKKLPTGLTLFTPKKGQSYKLVFLPWKGGKNRDTGVGKWVTNRYVCIHKQIGPREESFLCSASRRKPCAVCEEYAKLRNTGSGDEFYKKVLAPLKAKDRELMLVWDVTGNSGDIDYESRKLHVWDESTFLFGDAFRGLFRKKKDWMLYADLDNGCVVEIEAREKKMGTSTCTDFTQGILIEKREEALPQWIEDAVEKYCLDDLVQETPYGELKKLLSQTGDKEEEEEQDTENEPEDMEEQEEEETPPAKKPVAGKKTSSDSSKNGKSGKKKEPEPEEDEEEPEEVEEDVEDEVVDDEEEPEDEEPEEEPEAPSPPRKPIKRKS